MGAHQSMPVAFPAPAAPATASAGIPASVEKRINTKLLVPYLSLDANNKPVKPLIRSAIDIIRSGKYDPRVPVDSRGRSLPMMAIHLYSVIGNLDTCSMYEIIVRMIRKYVDDTQNPYSMYHRDLSGYSMLHYIAKVPAFHSYHHSPYFTSLELMATPYRAIINEQSTATGSTALIIAAKNRSIVAIRVLIKLGALVGIKDTTGNTAAHHLFLCTRILYDSNCISALVNQAYVERVNIMAPNNEGKTPMDLLEARKSSIPDSDYQEFVFELNRGIELLKSQS